MKSKRWSLLNKFIKTCGLTWLVSIVFFLLTAGVYLILANKLKIPLSDNLITTIFIIEVITGVLSFGLMVLSAIFLLFLQNEIIIITKRSPIAFIFALLKFILILAVLPLFLIIRLINPKSMFARFFKKNIKPISKKTVLRRVFGIIIICITILPVWAAGYAAIGYISLNQLGYIQEPIPIVGTGSMYPTFPKGEGRDPKELYKQIVGTSGMFRYPNGLVLFDRRYFNHTIGRGDIVIAENDKTREVTKKQYGNPSGFIKRVIAIPGDKLEIRDGIVYLNDQPQKEPYVARARSTFGGDFLPDCKALTIPTDKYFIMGDNRKGSGDSRHELGLIDEKDVKYALPFSNQKGSLDKHWHDPSNDLADTAKISLDKAKFLELLNQKRKEYGGGALAHEPKLDASAQKRGEIILKYNDFSYEATRSGYTMTRAANDSGYYNIIYGEWAVPGYYDAEELIDNLFAFPKGKEFLSNKDYDDFGVSEVQGQLNNCPVHLVVLHFAGYVPPNYSKDVVESWKTALAQLQNIQPSWQRLKTYQQFYDAHRNEVDRINDVISQRITNMSGIVVKMDANQWLTNEQNNYTEKLDKALGDEQESLAKKLNSY